MLILPHREEHQEDFWMKNRFGMASLKSKLKVVVSKKKLTFVEIYLGREITP